MERRKTSFDDHMSVFDANVKTASFKKDQEGASLLEKIANELGFNKEAQAPTAEGEVSPAASSVAGANSEVVGATEAVTMPQTTIAGGNPAESAAGEVPAATKPNEGLAISAGDGQVTDAANLHKTPEAVAAAAKDGGGAEAAASPAPEIASSVPDNDLGAEKTAEAKQIGIVIANSFQEELQKIAADQEYSEALSILKEAGLMDDYKINDEGIQKTASIHEGGLEKIAKKQSVSREDIISAAVEYIELSKEAEYAEEQGRADAREMVTKLATSNDEEEKENEKIASLSKDPDIAKAVKLLKSKNVI